MWYKNIKLEKTGKLRNIGIFEIYSSKNDLLNNKELSGYSVRIKTHKTSKKKFISYFTEIEGKHYDKLDEEYGINYFDFQKLENAEKKFAEMMVS